MNVYDFDKTIYNGDSTVDFYFYMLKRKPSIILHGFKQILGMILYVLHIFDKTKMKVYFYSFLKSIDNIDVEVKKFWNDNENKIFDWYKNDQKSDDVIISASPEFLLNEICNRLDIKYLIASRVNKENGDTVGENCYGEEKVKRFNEKFKDEKIDNFYSDSKSDQPLANLANNSFLIVDGKITNWR